MYSQLKALSIIFGTSEERLKEIIDKKGDLFQGIADDTGMSRQDVKHWAHGAMYSVGPESLKGVKDV